MLRNSERCQYFAPCTLGLEQVLESELRDLGAHGVRRLRGAVAFAGDVDLGYAANLWLRTAFRVQEQLLVGRASSPEELYRLVQRLDWSRYLNQDLTFAVDASVRSSGITHSKYAALKTKDAIVDQFRQRRGWRPSVDTTTPQLPMKLAIIKDECRLYRNLSGPSLHKRGWRPIQVKTPLNEAIAAGLLIMSGWDRQSPLVDPMCGSGTFLVEAACLATERAPGLHRTFAFESWLDFDQVLWKRLKRQARRRLRFELPFSLEGADCHAGALSLARRGANEAGVDHLVRLQVADARDFKPSCRPAQVVVNPPYGERLGSGEEVEESWRALGNFLHRECRGAVAHVLSGNPELPRLLGLRASRKMPVMNGPIDCRWLRYEIREG